MQLDAVSSYATLSSAELALKLSSPTGKAPKTFSKQSFSSGLGSPSMTSCGLCMILPCHCVSHAASNHAADFVGMGKRKIIQVDSKHEHYSSFCGSLSTFTWNLLTVV